MLTRQTSGCYVYYLRNKTIYKLLNKNLPAAFHKSFIVRQEIAREVFFEYNRGLILLDYLRHS